jgi:hypothetical protein
MSNKIPVESFSQLASIIEETHFYFLQQVQKQVNIALTLRNWLIGQYIVEYEQNGADRAEYGKALITKLSQKLRQRNLKGFSEIALRLNRSFYLNYPGIQQTLSVNFQLADSQNDRIQPTLSVELQTATPVEVEHGMDVSLLLNHLSFSHFIELIKTANPVARSFYEIETLKNNWTVRQLQRAMIVCFTKEQD